MQINPFKTALALLVPLLLACSEQPEADRPDAGPVEVRFGAGADRTRTSVSNDWRRIYWHDDDRIMLWATDPDGSVVLARQIFSLAAYGSNANQAEFATLLDTDQEAALEREGAYTYTAFYPPTDDIAEGRITYRIPATQDGAYHGDLDILSADAVQGEGLAVKKRGDVFLPMRHRLHAVRIRIPDQKNLLGGNIVQLKVEFPIERKVVGRLTFDSADPAADPELTDGSHTVTLNLATPISDGRHYAWFFIAPVELTGGEVTFTAVNEEGYSSLPAKVSVDKLFAGGNVTPFALTVPRRDARTTLRYTVTANNLGETPHTITFKAPEGAEFDGGATELSFAYAFGKTYDLIFDGDLYGELMSRKGVTITYDSENAEVSRVRPTTGLQVAKVNNYELTVPYLFEEDFSSLTGGFNVNDDQNVNTASGHEDYSVPTALADCNGSDMPAGWIGARCGAAAGGASRGAVRIMCRNATLQEADLRNRTYNTGHGRIDAPALTGIKPGKTLKIAVAFDYASAREQSGDVNQFLQPYFAVGLTAQPVAWDSSYALFWKGNVRKDTGIDSKYLTYGIPDPIFTKESDTSMGGSYASIGQHKEFRTTATRDHRLVWEVYMDQIENNAYHISYPKRRTNNYLYIDNIRVWIEP